MGVREIIKCSTVVCTVVAEDVKLEANSEVDHIFWVPLRTFLGEGDNHWQEKTEYRKKFPMLLDYFRIPGHSDFVVWGLTARLCTIVASIVYSRPPAFPFAHYYISSVDSGHIGITKFMLP